MLKFYRAVLAVGVVIVFASCKDSVVQTVLLPPGTDTTTTKTDTVKTPPDTTKAPPDTVKVPPPPVGTVDSIKMTLTSYHGSIGDILTPTVQVFTTGTISNDFDCTSDNAGDVTATTVVMSDGKHCKFTLIATTPLSGVGAVQVCAETLEAHTFPDKTQDRLRACAEIYVKP